MSILDDLFDRNGDCLIPVWQIPPPTLPEEKDTETPYAKLSNEDHTWFVGTSYMQKYFTVYDNPPTEKDPSLNYNYFGIARCKSNHDHINIAVDTD